MRRVLVIAYYFPPMGLSGVQRVAKFVKYLPAYGWQPTVLTVEPGGYFAYDESLLREVEAAGAEIVRTRSLDPTRLFGRAQTVALPEEKRRQWLAALSSFLFVPDNKVGWMPFAIRQGHELLERDSFDAILSSAPPYTVHCVSAWLSRQHNVPLVVDFRDDWVGNPRHTYPTPFHRWVHQTLERWVLRRSRHAVTINEPIRRGLIARNLENTRAPDVSVLPQGYDPTDFAHAPEVPATERIRFVYTGIFYDAQTPNFFLRALARLLDNHPEAREALEAVFVGLVPEASQDLARALGIDDCVRYTGYVDHRTAVAYQLSADVLWMTVGRRPGAEGISTSKLYEYFGARKPILALVPEGAVADALAEHGAAWIVPPDDVAAIEDGLYQCWTQWQAEALPEPDEAYVRTFDRKVLAGRLAQLLD